MAVRRNIEASPADEAWIGQFGRLYRQNGYLSPPVDIYRGFLPLIARSGTVLELGCGNGMLLRYILEHSSHAIVPFGVDLDRRAIEVARTLVLPGYADNFLVSDIRNLVHPSRPFDIVLTNPVYANKGYYEQIDGKIQRLHPDGSIRRFVEHCMTHRASHGQLIMYCYEEEYQRIPNFWAVFNDETTEYELTHRLSELGRAAYWVIE
jgi:SAM-dependent methyltransferase